MAFLVLESLTLGVFLSLDLLLFYVFFEAVLIPMYFIIGIWGSRARKIQAAYMFFLYTLAGSVLMLLALVLIATEAGTTDLLVLPSLHMSFERQVLVWMAFFVAFGVKIPMVPMHVWLPEAHVEAPTGGSVFLAGIMLKLGGYGLVLVRTGPDPVCHTACVSDCRSLPVAAPRPGALAVRCLFASA